MSSITTFGWWKIVCALAIGGSPWEPNIYVDFSFEESVDPNDEESKSLDPTIKYILLDALKKETRALLNSFCTIICPLELSLGDLVRYGRGPLVPWKSSNAKFGATAHHRQLTIALGIVAAHGAFRESMSCRGPSRWKFHRGIRQEGRLPGLGALDALSETWDRLLGICEGQATRVAVAIPAVAIIDCHATCDRCCVHSCIHSLPDPFHSSLQYWGPLQIFWSNVWSSSSSSAQIEVLHGCLPPDLGGQWQIPD